MLIIMLQTRYGSEDGFVVRCFQKNREYEVADSLAGYFIRHKLARAIAMNAGTNNIQEHEFPSAREQ